MIKRVFAWILLVLFVLLLVNIAVFRFYWEISLTLYILIMAVYIYYITVRK